MKYFIENNQHITIFMGTTAVSWMKSTSRNQRQYGNVRCVTRNRKSAMIGTSKR
jgi:hypothetical protein